MNTLSLFSFQKRLTYFFERDPKKTRYRQVFLNCISLKRREVGGTHHWQVNTGLYMSCFHSFDFFFFSPPTDKKVQSGYEISDIVRWNYLGQIEFVLGRLDEYTGRLWVIWYKLSKKWSKVSRNEIGIRFSL